MSVMDVVNTINSEINCLWAYKNPDLAAKCLDDIFEQFGERGTYSCDMSRDGFFVCSGTYRKSYEANNDHVEQDRTDCYAWLTQHVACFTEQYRNEPNGKLVMEQYDETRAKKIKRKGNIMTELEKDRLEACMLIRTILNTEKNGGCGWMYAFEKLARIDEQEKPVKVLTSEDRQYMKRLVTRLDDDISLNEASSLLKEASYAIEELLNLVD